MNALQANPSSVGLLDIQAFENTQRIANMLSQSTLVPEQYRATIAVKTGQKDQNGNPIIKIEPNANGLANCIIALNMANRMGADPLMVMQNLYLIEGRPAWSSQFILASLNSCGRFSALRFDIEDLGEVEVEYQEYQWNNTTKKRELTNRKTKVRNLTCVAWAIEKETGDRIESSKISVEMAVKEGWYGKNGSKWKTMPEQMLRYRAASFFGRIYAPEILMGLRSDDEERDMIDVTPSNNVTTVIPKTSTSELKQRILAAKQLDELEVIESEVNTIANELSDREYDVLIDLIQKKSQQLADVKPKKSKKDKVVDTQTEVKEIDLSVYYANIANAENLEQLQTVADEIKALDLGEPAKTELRTAFLQRKEQLSQLDLAVEMPIPVIQHLEKADSLEQLNHILATEFEPFTAQMSEQVIDTVTAVYERKVAELTP